MPNWCQNTLHVDGAADDVAAFVKAARGREHTYKDYSSMRDKWPVYEDIRLRALYDEPPALSDRESDLSFHSLVPIPDEVLKLPYDSSQAKSLADLLDLPDKKNALGGHAWENQNWGVKWGACEVNMDHNDPECASYHFDTAWGPPLEFLERVAEDWPSLRFELSFEESGMGFGGEVVYEDGCCVHENNYDMDYDEEDEDDI